MDAELLLTGSHLPAPEWIPLTCGPLSLGFDPVSGGVRRLRVGEREALKNIYVAVRDQNWDTIAPQLSDLHIATTDGGFRITFVVRCYEHEVDFAWNGEIIGEPDGTLRYMMDGVALSDFRRNRIGLCVLHPLVGCVGAPCMIEKTDGANVAAQFPNLISPNQPFKEIRAITHTVLPGVRAEVRFEGDTFEMEDQRNWTDASFKTYSTPIELPYPVPVAKGERVRQSVTFRLHGQPSPVSVSAADAPVILHLKGRSLARPLPKIGLNVPAGRMDLAEREVHRLAALNLSHFRADVVIDRDVIRRDMMENATIDALGAYIRAKQSGEIRDSVIQPLANIHVLIMAIFEALEASVDIFARRFICSEYALFLLPGEEKELQSWRRLGTTPNRDNIARTLIYHRTEKSTPRPLLEMAKRKFSEEFGATYRFPVMGGTNAYFAELNRERPPLDALDGVCFSINPQVHVFDNASLVETLAAQAEAVRSARALFPRKRIAVSPVTLRPRFNPNATEPEPEPLPGELPTSVDVRQMSLFGAGWTLGSLKYLSESGANSVTYYETMGWRGVMEREAGSPLPEKFPSIPGAVFPLYHVLADVGEFRGGKVLPIATTDPLRVEAMTMKKESRVTFLVANLTETPQTFRLTLPPSFQAQRSRQLDASNAEFAMREPERYRVEAWQPLDAPRGIIERELPPYAVLRLDYEEGE